MYEPEQHEKTYRMCIANTERKKQDAGWASVCGWMMVVIVMSAVVALTGIEVAPAQAEPIMCEGPE